MKHNPQWKSNIALFLVGQSITLFGSTLVYYAIMWHILLQTDSGVMMALTTAMGTLPIVLISPFAGVWADRYNKKLIINIADAAIAVVTLGMAVVLSLGMESIVLFLICLAVRAFGQGVQTPAVNALLPSIVPAEQLMRVNGISSSVHSFVMIASPIAASALISKFPIQALMYIDVATAIVGVSLLFFLVKVPVREAVAVPPQGARQYYNEIGQGIRYIGQRAFLKKFLFLSALFNVFVAPLAMLTPLQVTRNWGDGVWTLLGTAFGPEKRLATVEIVFFVGMMLGGLLMSIWRGFKNKSHTMALSTFMLGVSALLLGLLTNFWLYMLSMALCGIVLSIFNPPMMTTMQTNVDPAYMGRVFSVLSMMGSTMMPLSMMLWGPLADRIDINYLLILSGLVIFSMGIIFLADKTLLAAGAAKPKEPNEPPASEDPPAEAVEAT